MKKVLIITYYWPPAGGPGVQRWLKFVKYLKEFGVEPVVYTPQNPNYPMTDASLEKEVSNDIQIIKTKIFEPYGFAGIFSKNKTSEISSGIIPEEKQQGLLQKFLLFVRGNFFIPDARKFWIKPSVEFLEDYLKKGQIDTIITTGPPHSMHLIGLQLKRKLGLRWIADFRDPWTEIGYHKKLKLSKKSAAKHNRLEKEVLNGADLILTTSFTTRKEFLGKTNKPVKVLTNGFDIEQTTNGRLDKEFSFSHIGSLLSGRNPQNLWKVLGELVKENNDFSEDFKLKLVGRISGEVVTSVKENGLEKYCEIKNYVSHEEAVKLQRSSQVLLLIEIDSEETKGIIPGKLFEYLAAKRPILGIGPLNWDAARIVEETNAGSIFTYKISSNLKNQILKFYELYKNDQLLINSHGIEKYSRRNLTRKLAEIIKEGK